MGRCHPGRPGGRSPVQLTPAGQSLLEQLQGTLEELAQARELLRSRQVVSMSSVARTRKAYLDIVAAHYSTTKAALIGMTRHLAGELGLMASMSTHWRLVASTHRWSPAWPGRRMTR